MTYRGMSVIVWLCAVMCALSGTAQARDVGRSNNILNITSMPINVAEIVEAISNVQKDVTNAESIIPNIKVAVSNISIESEPPTTVAPEIIEETTVSEPVPTTTRAEISTEPIPTDDAPPAVAVIHSDSEATSSDVIEDEEVGVILETTEVPSFLDTLNTPATSIFSTNGVSQWFNWVVSMRDPILNPEGSAGWPTIISRGFQGLVNYYNPFRSFGFMSRMSRALTNSETATTALLSVYENREDIINALQSDKLEPSIINVINYVQDLENKKIADKISILSERNDLDTEAKQELVEGDIPGSALVGALTAPLDVKIVNFLLKGLYIVIALAFIPFSGIDNFFLAPLPPDMDSLSGQLRFFGLQALLGPDYVIDYEYSDEVLDGDEYLDDDEYYDDYDNRRNDTPKRKTAKNNRKKVSSGPKKREKPSKISRNGNDPLNMSPPPSRYGDTLRHRTKTETSSYSSYTTEAEIPQSVIEK